MGIPRNSQKTQFSKRDFPNREFPSIPDLGNSRFGNSPPLLYTRNWLYTWYMTCGHVVDYKNYIFTATATVIIDEVGAVIISC